MKFKTHDAYRCLIEKARWSHDHNRTVFHIEDDDVALARLYVYGYRSQTIGAFHGCREAIVSVSKSGEDIAGHRHDATRFLKQLENLAITAVPTDFRALLFTLYYYDQWVLRTIEAMEADCLAGNRQAIETIKDRFIAGMERITNSNGLCGADDRTLPEQASFVVPNLGLTIVPLVYGDHHSWNCAHLTAGTTGVPLHRHRRGVEIHLGFSPIHGRTILDDHFAELHEGYAMPIPAMTDHGFDNLSSHEHIVPFIFGSMSLTGWGVFFDVEPRPKNPSELTEASLDSEEMNHSIYLERHVRRMSIGNTTRRELVIPASATQSNECGGLQLSIACIGKDGLRMNEDTYTIFSLLSGSATIRMGPATAPLTEHDHVGLPAGIEVEIVPQGDAPVVTLDVTIR